MLFRTVPSAHTLVRGEDGLRLRRRSADSTWTPLWPTGSSSGLPPSITARCFSASPSDSTSRWTPCPPRSPRPGPARHYPRFWIWRPPSERQEDFNLPEHVAAWHTLRTHPPPSRRPPPSRGTPGYRTYPASVAFAAGRGGFLQLLDLSCVTVLSLPPRRSGRRPRSGCRRSCGLRLAARGSAFGDHYQIRG